MSQDSTPRRGRKASRGLAACAAAATIATGLVAVGGLTTLADAQVAISMTRSLGSPAGASGMVTRRSVDRYATLLGFDEAQREAAALIHEGYASAFGERRRVMQDAMETVRRSAEDTGDMGLFIQRLPAINKEFEESTKKLEKEFFQDLRALLADAAQEERWASVERMRRREVGLTGGQVSGSSVDLVSMVEDLKLPQTAAPEMAGLLDGYEREMDRLLIAKAEREAREPVFEMGKPIDIEAIQKAMAESQEAALRIRDLNTASARRIEGMLPDAERAKFAEEFRRLCHPRVYRSPHVLRELDEALKMSDLDAQQREQLALLKEGYTRRLPAINDAWAAAVEAAEKDGKTGGAVGGGAHRIAFNAQDEPEDLVRTRTARRELDEQTAERLRSLLSAAQRDRLPRRDDDDMGPGGAPRGRMMINRGG
ncbi:MAG: hypothetical protein KF859_01495 [Phycisphaeraceae bacterium]|nr:hypothetical protein [Phycisphaeraceae bacterium]